MAGKIYPIPAKGKTYYYYKESHRIKINQGDKGKVKGSGKSKVKTISIYLGTAEDILSWKRKTKGPISVKHRSFGLIAAAYQTAKECGLIDVLQKHIQGERYGMQRWIWFFVTILNRIDHASSKNKMQDWAKKSVLPDILNIDVKNLTSKRFWYVTDDIISEADLKKKRAKHEVSEDDIFCGLDDSVFRNIENDLFANISSLMPQSANALISDATNFFSFFEAPDKSELACPGHNKNGRHNLRQVGLTMTIDKSTGIPFFHRVYRGNSHDSTTFYQTMSDLMTTIMGAFKKVNELVLVLDKGNNKKETFDYLKDKIEWVGSLVPSQHEDLLSIPIDEYEGSHGKLQYLRKIKKIMGHECVLIMTHNPELEKKQRHSLENGIVKLKKKLRDKFNSYKRKPTTFSGALSTILKENRYGKFIKVTIKKSALNFEFNDAPLRKHKNRLGKNLLFTSKADAETAWIIDNYREKDLIEKAFETMKDVDLIRIRPLRHWTDTKIRAYIFCCVQSLILIRLMQYKAKQANLEMSANVLKEELGDLREILMIYENNCTERKISAQSSVQKKLYELFKLSDIEKSVIGHYSLN